MMPSPLAAATVTGGPAPPRFEAAPAILERCAAKIAAEAGPEVRLVEFGVVRAARTEDRDAFDRR